MAATTRKTADAGGGAVIEIHERRRAEKPCTGQILEVRACAEQLVARAREDGLALTGEGGLLTDLMRHVLQTGLEVELSEHLGYEPHERGRGAGNARNGFYDKTATTEIGEVDLRVPRD